MRALSRSLDLAADHVGNVLLFVFALVGVGGLVAGLIYALLAA